MSALPQPADDAACERRRVAALTAIATAVAHGADLDAVLEAALEATLAALDLQVGGIYLRDDESGELRATRHTRGVPPEYAEAVARFEPGEAILGRALQGPAPIVVPDLSAASEAREATRRLGLRAFVFVPLFARGHALGVMPVGGFVAREFSEQDLRLLEAAGGMLGGAVENARLLGRTQRHLEQVEALWELDRAIVEGRDFGDVLRTLAREAALLAGGDSAVLLLGDDGEAAVAASHGPAAVACLGSPPALAGAPVAGLLASGSPQVARVAQDSGPLRALLLPLREGERPLGGLFLTRPESHARGEDLPVLAGFAQQAALALARARLREVEDRRAAQLALVSAASEIAASTLDVGALLGAIARYIQRSFNYHGVEIYLVEPQAREAELAGAAGGATAQPKGARVRFGQGIVGWVAEHGEYVLTNDVRREPRFARSRLSATQAQLAVPVRLSGEIVAVINVESDRLGAFDEGDVVAIDAIAAQVASAIRNARLFEEKVRALRNLEILQEITNVLNSDLDLDSLLDRIARRSVEVVRNAQMGVVLLYDGEALVARSSFGFPRPQALKAVRMAFHEGLPGSVFVSGHGRVAAFAAGDHGRHAEAFQEAAGGAEPTGALCVPISRPEEKLGVLLLESVSAPEAFDTDDLLFALTLADQAAIAIGNALRLRRILELDRQRREYLSNVSHELRTPLTVVQGYIDALIDGSAGAQAASFLGVARDQCQRLGRMLDEVLEVSRLERGVAQRHLSLGAVAMDELVRRALAAVRQDALAKELRLAERTPAELPTVPGDARLLYMLLLHLVENAVKFTPRGGSVEAAVEVQGDELVASVTDTGIGIPLEHQERIFEKFYTVDGGLNRSHGGAGIGLYLAREIAAIHKGLIRVASQPGAGTRIEVRLPLSA